MKAQPRPLTILQEQKPLMDTVKTPIRELRQEYLEDRLRVGSRVWDASVYVPIEYYLSYLVFVTGGEMEPEALGLSAAIAAGLHSWSMTRDVFRFDPEVASQLVSSSLKGEIPTTLLKRLPGWCVYVDTTGLGMRLEMVNHEVVGFFAHLDDDPRGWMELRLLFDVGQEKFLFPLPIPLKGTIEEALRSLSETAQIPLPFRQKVQEASTEHFGELTAQALNLLLWLCSEEPDIVGKGHPSKPSLVKTKQGLREFPVSERVRSWDVAYRYGSRLRLAEERFEREQQEAAGEGRSRPRPHYRKPHWHVFWTGPRDGERVAVVRWLPRIPVNMDLVDPEELPAVVHRIQE